MKKVLMVVSALTLLVFLVSCGNVAEEMTEEMAEQQIEAETGGDVEIESSGFNGDGWCEEGAQWKYAAEMEEGSTNAQWMVEGLMTSGEYEGLCHVVYIAEGPDGDARMDYYFSEDGESGYFEMNINGQTMKSEWSK